jgi:hypothetical protein
MIDKFINIIEKTFPPTQLFSDHIRKSIIDSGCQKICFSRFKNNAMGLSLHDGVYINERAIQFGMDMLLFIVFHELAHQYQYKKYGVKKMYDAYDYSLSIEEVVDTIHKIEIVADEFSHRKIRELQKIGYIDVRFVPPRIYQNIGIDHLRNTIGGFRSEMGGVDNVSEFFYNKVIDKEL